MCVAILLDFLARASPLITLQSDEVFHTACLLITPLLLWILKLLVLFLFQSPDLNPVKHFDLMCSAPPSTTPNKGMNAVHPLSLKTWIIYAKDK